MKLFLDTNIIIDVIANRQPWVQEALILLELAKEGCTYSFGLFVY